MIDLGLWLGPFVILLFILAAREAQARPRDCLACGRFVPSDEGLVERPDLRICEDCVRHGLAELHASTHALSRAGPFLPQQISAQCNFCGREAAAECSLVSFPRTAICRDCLHTCQTYFQPEPTWLRPEVDRQVARDTIIHFVISLLGLGAFTLLWWHSCTAG